MSQSKHERTTTGHGVFFLTDVNKFSTKRANLDMKNIRKALYKMLLESIEEVEIDISDCKVNDTGDGFLIILPPETPKEKLITKAIPHLKYCLMEHNRVSADVVKFKLRAVLHFGEYITDWVDREKEGLVGNEIIAASRLLDSDQLRNFVRRYPEEEPICLAISDDFFEKVIKQHLPIFEKEFSSFEFETKDRNIKAWVANLEHGFSSETSSKKAIPQIQKEAKKNQIYLKELNGRCILFSTADVYVHDLYKRTADTVPLREHLEAALLLSDKVLIHYSDPYRSYATYKLLKEYKDFIEQGDILILLGSGIHNIKMDYMKKIKEKASQYSPSGYSTTDLEHLQPKHATDGFIKELLDLLDMTSILLYRGFGGTERFTNLVRKDFEKVERIATYGFPGSKVSKLNLTLYQILHMVEIDEPKMIRNLFGEKEKLNQVISEVYDKINMKSFSRQILVEIFRDILGEKFTGIYRNFVESRVNLLYLHINTDVHSFIEPTRERDSNSPYYYEYLFRHLGILGGHRTSRNRLGPNMIRKLKDIPEWSDFIEHHLAVMTEVYTQRLGDYPRREPDDYFRKELESEKFIAIQNILSE